MGFLDSKIKVLDNGREVLTMPDSVNFAFKTKDNYLLLASQFRASNNKNSLNLFGGYIENDEDWMEAMYREAKEEANIDREDIIATDCIVFYKYVSMGYTTERNTTCILHLNKELKELQLQCNDLDESIEIVSIFIDQDSITNLSINAEGIKLHLVCEKLLNQYI